MGASYSVPTTTDPWGVFESPASRVPIYRSMLAPVPWIFRDDPNKPFLVLLAMIGAWIGLILGVRFALEFLV